MVSLITDYIQETAASYLGAGIVALGSLAGNAVGGTGGLIESSGRAVGNGVAGGIGGIGGYVNSYGDSIRGSMAPDGPARASTSKRAVRREVPVTRASPRVSAPTTVPSSNAVRRNTTTRTVLKGRTISDASKPRQAKSKSTTIASRASAAPAHKAPLIKSSASQNS